jgi:aryl-phospho-beta-D-glucosidase BglC (GH1 family)
MMTNMKNLFLILTALLLTNCSDNAGTAVKPAAASRFIGVNGPNLVTPDGGKFFIRGINLGNWLNPEGYMFGFGGEASSYRQINEAFCELVGPGFAGNFWREFQKNYITEEDIKFIRQTGMNSVRVPFHYKLFTTEDYMGGEDAGFALMDSVVGWCARQGLYVILDMHDAPGGQTGDNIDDSFGYPWLMGCEESKVLFCSVWKKIAAHYAGDTAVLGYDLLNEPIATHFREDYSILNDSLEPLYKRCVAEIRKVDGNHVVLLGGAQWNSNFRVFRDSKFDNRMMYTCHRYWCDTLQANIQDFVHFRDSVNLPLYMGETGENTFEWIAAWTRLMERNNIGWHYWPYKKMLSDRCMTTIPKPENWDLITAYTRADRSSFAKIRAARPDQATVRKAMSNLLENMKLRNCVKSDGYIEATGMKP